MKQSLPIMKSIFAASSVAVVMATALISSANAGDCKKVKFRIYNDEASRVKVTGIRIVGNDGTWTENISNTNVDANGGNYETNKRRLNRLDSGATGDFRVIYRQWDAANNRWSLRTTSNSQSYECSDDMTIELRIPG